jgi:flagellar basal-body rod modification protein FlgD
MTTGVGSAGTNNASSANSTANSSLPSTSNLLGSNFNTFLTLLTTQLKNQDPTSPLDTNQFTSQLVQFAQVEQAINTNTNLQALITIQEGEQSVTALPLVGQTVEYAANTAPMVNSQPVEFGYNLPSTAADATITIQDANGKTVFTGPAELSQGSHTFTWDGKGSDGTQEPDGVYTFNVSATASDKSSITASLTAFAKVQSVQVDKGLASVVLGGGETQPLSNIVSVNGSNSSSSGSTDQNTST